MPHRLRPGDRVRPLNPQQFPRADLVVVSVFPSKVRPGKLTIRLQVTVDSISETGERVVRSFFCLQPAEDFVRFDL